MTVGGLAAMSPVSFAEGAEDMNAQFDADLSSLAAFGILRSGGAGDQACGNWISQRLEKAGFKVDEQSFGVPWFKAEQAVLTVGNTLLPVWPQAVVKQTGPKGLEAQLGVYSTDDDLSRLAGAIAVVDLPYARHSSLNQPGILKRIKAAEDANAKAILLVTNGPTGDPLLLNAHAGTPAARVPLCVLGPSVAAPVFDAAARGERARLLIRGDSGHRPARNVFGWRDGTGPALVVSTPRSGWFTCIGERGPGIVSFLRLAETLPRRAGGRPVLMVATSGHEYENLGAAEFLGAEAPDPRNVALWLHLGAGFAARNWHEAGGRLAPLDSPDPQRFLLASEALLPTLQPAFSQISGLRTPYELDNTAAGEVGTIARHGYNRAFGLLGAHRFHHSPNDDLRMTTGHFIAPVVTAIQNALNELLP
ncbi:MAG: hypothetical protein VYC38_01885 [Pseudomonadota bacterium]|nr:hypothetical protein [Pseudomonadota bacterium]